MRDFCYRCEGFTHPLGRAEKSKVKGIVGLENVFENLGVWAPLYSIIIHILLGVIREVWCKEKIYGVCVPRRLQLMVVGLEDDLRKPRKGMKFSDLC